MIKKLRLQVVAICMLLVTTVLLGVFYSLYRSSQRSLQRDSEEFLYQIIDSDPRQEVRQSELVIPGKPGRAELIIGGDAVQFLYFTVEIWEQTAYVTGGTYADLEDTALLKNILNQCLTQDQWQGTLDDYNLRYLRRDNVLFTKVAFVDMSMEQSSLQSMIHSSLKIGAGALLVLLGVSVLLAYLVSRPVERAWNQQHQFLSDASHELKTPLTVILSNAELLGSQPLENKPARWADNIRTESVQMKSLVEEMLTLARADNMVRTCVFSQVSLSDAAVDCALLFEPLAFESDKSLDYDAIAPEALVSGDGEKLRQVISVLLDNAIKYGAAGEPVTLCVSKTDRQARLTVANRGAPIPPEQLGRLFERFYRADASRGERSGFGLGLSIAASIAAEHKGTLKAESDAQSTRFILTLPLLKK